MTAWLRRSARLSGPTAWSITRTGRRLRALPVTSGAWLNGTLSGGQVQAIVANLDDDTAPLFAEHEAAMVPSLTELLVKETASAMQAWKARAEAVDDKAGPAPAPRALHLSEILDGTWRLDGTLGPLDGSIVETALRLAATEGAEGEHRTPSEKRADPVLRHGEPMAVVADRNSSPALVNIGDVEPRQALGPQVHRQHECHRRRGGGDAPRTQGLGATAAAARVEHGRPVHASEPI